MTTTSPTSVPPPATPVPAPSERRLVDLLLVLLTAAAGATDAVAYLGLGGVFTANMTGNLVLFGIAGAHGVDLHFARVGVAVLAFVAGLVVAYRGTAVTGTGGWLWPRRVTAMLAVDFGAQTAFAVVWACAGARPGHLAGLGLVALSGAAMGLQTAAARRLAKAGITTTFVTGTLTSVAESLSAGSTRDVLRRCCVLAGLVAGALAGALLMRLAPVAAAVLAPVLVLVTLLAAGRRLHGRRG